jgi:antitoxin (DNA-binding transcriptional repressor) of toxin-antitoxin stability system
LRRGDFATPQAAQTSVVYEAIMSVIATTDLAERLPQILQGLAAGEEFVLTDAGRPVARIIPPEPAAPEKLAILEQQRQIFEEWMKIVEARADRYPPGFVLDDSYQAIYGEREDSQL